MTYLNLVPDKATLPLHNVAGPLTPDTAVAASARQPKRAHIWEFIGGSVLLGIESLADAIFLVPIFNQLQRDSPTLSYLLSIIVGVAFSSGAFVTGALFKVKKWWFGAGLAMAALVFACCLCAVRIQVAKADAELAGFSSDGTLTGVAANEVTAAYLMTAFLLLAFISGMVFGWRWTLPPAATELRRFEQHVATTATAHHAALAAKKRFEVDLEAQKNARTQIPQEREEARQHAEATGWSLLEHARARIALRVGDPAASNELDMPVARMTLPKPTTSASLDAREPLPVSDTPDESDTTNSPNIRTAALEK